MTGSLKVCYNKKLDSFYFKLTKKLLKKLDWKIGNKIKFIDNKDGSWTLKRV